MNLSKSHSDISDKELAVASFQAISFLHSKVSEQDEVIASLGSKIEDLTAII